MADLNPLLTLFLETHPNGATLVELEAFVASALDDPNNLELFDPETGATVQSNRTIFYSGTVGGGPDGVYTGNIAVDMASRAAEPTRVIDNTKIGRFFTSMTLDGALNEVVRAPPGDIADKANFTRASEILAATTKGEVIAIIGDDANPGKIFGDRELPALLKNPEVTHFDGIPADEFLRDITNPEIPESARVASAYGRLHAISGQMFLEDVDVLDSGRPAAASPDRRACRAGDAGEDGRVAGA